jgi:phosphate transport system substrate-binding protein
MSYVQENASKVKAVAVGSDKAVLPSASSVRDGSYQPLSRPLFLYVRSDRAREPSVQAFLSFYLSEGATLVEQVGYVGLSKELAATVLKRYEAGTEGTLYENGGQHGDRKSLDQLLR